MVKLVVAGIQLNVASDDFFLPAIVGISNKVVFVVVNVVLFLMLSYNLFLDECEMMTTNENVITFLGGTFLAVSTAALILYILMFHFSTQGSPCEPEKRKKLPSVLISTVFIYIVELAFACILTWQTVEFPRDGTCESTLTQKFYILIFACVMIWLDLIAFVAGCYIFLHRYDSSSRTVHLDDFDRKTVEWENCFRFWCKIFRVLSCNLFGYVGSGTEADDVYHSVAEIFNSWFNKTGLTVTDLLCAAILIRLQQKEERRAKQRYTQHEGKDSEFKKGKKARKKTYNVIEGSVRALDIDPGKDQTPDLERGIEHADEALQIFSEHFDYLKYMIAMYGWKLQMYAHTVRMQPFTAMRKIFNMTRRNADIGHGDNCCSCSKHFALEETGLTADDVIYGSFGSIAKVEEKHIQVPHAVFIDHEKKSIVIAMRGTLSLQDLMTDAMVEPTHLDTYGKMWGFEGKGYAHQGMLQIAHRIRCILEKNKVLHHMLCVEPKNFDAIPLEDTQGLEATNVDLEYVPRVPDYKLVVVGHSLGAAVGTLLCMMLRPTFPTARAICYAAPGATLSLDEAQKSTEWCTNIWLGHDIVPILNWQSLSRLRLNVFDVLARCKVSKARILRSALFGSSTADLMYDPHDVPDTPGRKAMQQKRKEFKEKRQSKKLEQIPMYTPGRIMHMTKLETVHHHFLGIPTKKQRIYEPHYVQDRTVLDDPVISTRSLFDHFPDLLPKAMAEIKERHEAELGPMTLAHVAATNFPQDAEN